MMAPSDEAIYNCQERRRYQQNDAEKGWVQILRWAIGPPNHEEV
jgi:hypothetical protein